MILDCKTCLIPFGTSKKGRRYCSVKCAAASRAIEPTQPCAQCKTMFRPRLNRSRSGQGRYCTVGCWQASRGAVFSKPDILRRIGEAGIAGLTTTDLMAILPADADHRLGQQDLATKLRKYVNQDHLCVSSDGPEWRNGTRLLVYRLPVYANAPVRPRDVTLHPIGQQIKRTHHAGQAIVLAGSKPVARPGVTIRASPKRGEATNPNNVPITYCPAARWDTRYQIDPATRFVKGFAAAGILRYDV